MTGRDAGLVVRALGSRLELDTRQTEYRGHAGELAASAAENGYGLVVTFSGDGTVNEVANGLMRVPEPARRPALAPVPGGGANVFARTLGLPPDAGSAVQRILDAVSDGRQRRIGLGLAGDRYFTFSAGLGLDAEVIGDMERQRAHGRRASLAAYLRTAVRRYYRTDRRRPALTLRVPGQPPISSLFMGVVTNSSPWTYLGSHPVRPGTHDDFSSGLDLFALRRLRTLTTLAALGHMMRSTDSVLPAGRDVVSASALSTALLRGHPPHRVPHRRRVPGRDQVRILQLPPRRPARHRLTSAARPTACPARRLRPGAPARPSARACSKSHIGTSDRIYRTHR